MAEQRPLHTNNIPIPVSRMSPEMKRRIEENRKQLGMKPSKAFERAATLPSSKK